MNINKKRSISFILLIIIFGIYYIRAESTSVRSGAYDEPLQVAMNALPCLYPSTLMKIDAHEDGRRISLPGKWRGYGNDIWNDFNTSDSFRVPVHEEINTVIGIGSEYETREFIYRVNCEFYAFNNLEDQLMNDSLLNKVIEIWQNESIIIPYEVVKDPTDVEFKIIDRTGLPIDFTYPEMIYPVFEYEKGRLGSIIRFNNEVDPWNILFTVVYNPYFFRNVEIDFVKDDYGIISVEEKMPLLDNRNVFNLISDNFPGECCFLHIKSFQTYPAKERTKELQVYFTYEALGNRDNTSIMLVVSKINLELGKDNEPTIGIDANKTWYKIINMTVKRW